MEISELTLKLILLLIPGALASALYEKLTFHKPWTTFQFIAHSTLFSGISYLIAQLFCKVIGVDLGLDKFWENLSSKEIPFEAIATATVAAFLISIGWTAVDYNKYLTRIARKLRITSKYGDESLYSHFLSVKDVKEVYVRDYAKNITYHGKLVYFSENAQCKELVLIDVDVYYEENEKKYSLDKLYISKSQDSIIIEIPFSDQENVKQDLSPTEKNNNIKGVSKNVS